MDSAQELSEVVVRFRDDFLSALLNADWPVAFYGVGAIAILRAVFLVLSPEHYLFFSISFFFFDTMADKDGKDGHVSDIHD